MTTMTLRKAVIIAATLAAVLMLAACPQGHSVADLQRNPGRYINKEVAVRGNVVSTFGLLGTGAYELNDGTGNIWILSEGYGIPSKGARVGVAGTLIEGANFGGRNLGLALRETHRVKN